jgi:lipopolysaccharide export LptBFGC system permease protein LptF
LKRTRLKLSLNVGLVAFILTFLVTFLIESPHPFWASLVVAFLIFEISYYYFFNKEKRQSDL